MNLTSRESPNVSETDDCYSQVQISKTCPQCLVLCRETGSSKRDVPTGLKDVPTRAGGVYMHTFNTTRDIGFGHYTLYSGQNQCLELY